MTIGGVVSFTVTVIFVENAPVTFNVVTVIIYVPGVAAVALNQN